MHASSPASSQPTADIYRSWRVSVASILIAALVTVTPLEVAFATNASSIPADTQAADAPNYPTETLPQTTLDTTPDTNVQDDTAVSETPEGAGDADQASEDTGVLDDGAADVVHAKEPASDSGVTATSSGDAVVTTDDAQSQTDATTELNTSVTDTATSSPTAPDARNTPTTTPPRADTTGTTTPGQTGTTPGQTGTTTDAISTDVATTTLAAGDGATTTVSNTNVATSTNAATTTAETGSNAAVSSGGSASVTTGDAAASANIINVINTSITNSSGFLLFLNAMFGGTVDLRSLFNDFENTATSTCSLQTCETGTLTTETNNTAHVTNSVIVRSSTGGNTASGSTTADVQTGNASALANVVNVVNTSFTNSTYMLMSVSNIGNLVGDIILPSGTFFDRLFGGGGDGAATVTNTNSATVTNTVAADADTGGNTASSTSGDATVTTGSAQSNTSVFTQANANAVGADRMFFLFRVFGNWTGQVFGAPNSIAWDETPTGVQLYNRDTSGTAPGADSVTASTTNTATITNDVQVYALTGENHVRAGGDAAVATGDASANASVVNVVNTNVVGRNWLFAVFNIFGDWDGNIAFGQPNLWVGGRVQGPDTGIRPGAEVVYRFTVANRGDADARAVVLEHRFDPTRIRFTDAQQDGVYRQTIGTVKAGTHREVTLVGHIRTDFGFGNTPISTETLATAAEPDADLTDNREVIDASVFRPRPQGDRGARWERTGDADIAITAHRSTSTATTPGVIDYELQIVNSGEESYQTLLRDQITDSSGTIVHENAWYLDTVYPDEEITVAYSVAYGTSTPAGKYTNNAVIEGIEWNPSPMYGHAFETDVATTSVQLLAPDLIATSTPAATTSPTVARAVATSTADAVRTLGRACDPYITGYVMANAPSSAETDTVMRIQQFLRTHMDPTLPITGVYGAQTVSAVHAFQETYRDTILTPWGLTEPTGNVYYLTLKTMNEVYCGDTTAFPLNAQQESEIGAYRTALLRETDERVDITPSDTETGSASPEVVRAARQASQQSEVRMQGILSSTTLPQRSNTPESEISSPAFLLASPGHAFDFVRATIASLLR